MRNTFGRPKQWCRHSCEFDGLGDPNPSARTSHSPAKKLAYILVALLMLMIGLAGILIPIIPGLLFLFMALFYLGKVSAGVKSWSDNHPILGKVNERIYQLSEVKITDRIRIVVLMGMAAFVSTISALLAFVREKIQK